MTSAGDTRPPAVLFDIDGTLVDSNYLHIQAWSEAFQAVGATVHDASIHRAIGMDSKELLAAVLGDDAERYSEKAKKKHTKRYAKLTSRLRRFEGARELLQEVSHLGAQVVLATSAPPHELAELLKVLDADEFIAITTNSDDVETAKPEPDLLQVALEKAGVSASRAVMIGDAVWDGVAAAKAGVKFVAVMSGGASAAELTAAGAIGVYDDVAHLRAQLDSSPLARLLD